MSNGAVLRKLGVALKKAKFQRNGHRDKSRHQQRQGPKEKVTDAR